MFKKYKFLSVSIPIILLCICFSIEYINYIFSQYSLNCLDSTIHLFCNHTLIKNSGVISINIYIFILLSVVWIIHDLIIIYDKKEESLLSKIIKFSVTLYWFKFLYVYSNNFKILDFINNEIGAYFNLNKLITLYYTISILIVISIIILILLMVNIFGYMKKN